MKTTWVFVALLGASLLNGCDVTDGNGKSNTNGNQDPDPVILDAPIAYVERPLPAQQNGNPKSDNLLQPADFNPGAKLILKARAAASAEEIVVTDTLFPPKANATGELVPQLYDVKDLSVSRDGTKLLFALHAPAIKNAGEDEQPTWNIWEYNRITKNLHRIIANDLDAEEGQDVQPAYMADGRIIFSSDRQETTREQNQDALRPAYKGQAEDNSRAAFNLHIVNADGTGLQQITFNPSHDLQPTPLNSGEIVFLRWDRLGHDNLSFYKINPDGTGLSFYYGYHSQNTGTDNTGEAADKAAVFAYPKVMADDRLLVSLRPRNALQLGGDLVAIDVKNYYEHDRSLLGSAGAEAQESLTKSGVYTHGKLADGLSSPAGYFGASAPMDDNSNRVLASWTPCRVINPDTQQPWPCAARFKGAAQATPEYALWMYNGGTQTQLPIKIPALGIQLQNPVILTAKPLLPSPASHIDDSLRAKKEAILHIQNVNDLGLTPYNGAKYVRLVKNIPLPAQKDLELVEGAFGVGGRGQGMREIVAYAALETDGSVKLKVPAEVPMMLDLVDATGKRLGGRHQNWLSLAAGETRECKGCHIVNNNNTPHGRLDAEPLTAVADIAQSKPAQTPSLDLQAADNRYSKLLSAINQNPSDSRCAPLAKAPTAWKPPLSDTCLTGWNASCAINISYLDNIQPLWDADRRVCDDAGIVVADNTCSGCHSRELKEDLSADALAQKLARDVQLELTAGPAQDDGNKRNFVLSYGELFFSDRRQKYEGGQSIDDYKDEIQQVPGPDGILVDTTVRVYFDRPAPLNINGARGNAGFFNLFANDPIHKNLLSPEELRLISEWLDLGAQYYNEPSKARKED